MSSRSNNCQGYFIHGGKESKDISADALLDWLGVTNVASQLKDDAQVESQLYTLQEVLQRLKISERTIHNQLNSSEWSGMLIARRWKFTEEDIQAYLKKQERKEGPKGAKKKRAYTRRITL